MPSVPPPPVEEVLNTFFAIQIRPHETVSDIAEAVLKTAKAEKLLFRKLEVLDTVTIGTTAYVRMRTDVPDAFIIVDKLHREAGRSVVSLKGSEYVVMMPGGCVGKVSNLLMHATAKLGQSRMFLGTKMKHWARQFAA